MTAAGMVALRLAATLAHALPGIRVRIRDQHRTLLDVARPPHPAGRGIVPCAFRMAVTRAHEQIKAGARLAFMGLPEGTDPAVDIGVRPCDRVLPGGIYRISAGDLHIHAFATTLSRRKCRDILSRRSAPTLEDDGRDDVRLHYDAATEVTLVHIVSPLEPVVAERCQQLEEVLADFVADEVLHELTTGS